MLTNFFKNIYKINKFIIFIIIKIMPYALIVNKEVSI